MEHNFENMTAAEFEKSNTILWGAMIAGCIFMSIILFFQSQSDEFYSFANFYNTMYMWISVLTAVGGYFIGNIIYQKNAEAGAALLSLDEKINAFRSSFVLKAAFLEGPTVISILFMMFDNNAYFLVIAALLLVAQFNNRPSNERFINDFKLSSAQKQEFLGKVKS